MLRIGINGFGRIGRLVLRALYETHYHTKMQIVAINASNSLEGIIHLLKYDSTHGPFRGEITIENNGIVVNGTFIRVFSERDPTLLPWAEDQVDLVFECTGKFTSKATAQAHIDRGAKKVLISAPGADVDATIVYGVNQQLLKATDLIVSNASCTTNCLAPVALPLHQAIGMEHGLMTTIHSYTSDQMLLDGNHNDFRRARCATYSMIPTKTGAAKALGLVIPELAGRLDGFAMRVPTANVSVVDLTFTTSKLTSVQEINQIMRQAAAESLGGILQYNEEPLVSIDFNHNPASAIFDATQTKVSGNLVKILAWYDNEWGFSNRMLDVAACMMLSKKQ